MKVLTLTFVRVTFGYKRFDPVLTCVRMTVQGDLRVVRVTIGKKNPCREAGTFQILKNSKTMFIGEWMPGVRAP